MLYKFFFNNKPATYTPKGSIRSHEYYIGQYNDDYVAVFTSTTMPIYTIILKNNRLMSVSGFLSCEIAMSSLLGFNVIFNPEDKYGFISYRKYGFCSRYKI